MEPRKIWSLETSPPVPASVEPTDIVFVSAVQGTAAETVEAERKIAAQAIAERSFFMGAG